MLTQVTAKQIKTIMPYVESNIKANKNLAGKDLGNVRTGDGVKYKGRGLIQLTGRTNYTTYKGYCGFDVVSQPELLAKPVGAVRSSMWFWSKKNLNYYADIDAFTTITKIINGGTNGWSDRMKYLKVAKRVFRVT